MFLLPSVLVSAQMKTKEIIIIFERIRKLCILLSAGRSYHIYMKKNEMKRCGHKRSALSSHIKALNRDGPGRQKRNSKNESSFSVATPQARSHHLISFSCELNSIDLFADCHRKSRNTEGAIYYITILAQLTCDAIAHVPMWTTYFAMNNYSVFADQMFAHSRFSPSLSLQIQLRLLLN